MNDNDVIDDDLLDLALKEIEKEERELIARLPLVARKIIADKESDVAAAKRREKQAVVQAKASAFDKLHLINVSAESVCWATSLIRSVTRSQPGRGCKKIRVTASNN